MEIYFHPSNIFTETRCTIKDWKGFNFKYDAANDVNPNTHKKGIRCYNAIYALFLRIFGKIATVKTEKGVYAFLDKDDFNEWKTWRKQQHQDKEHHQKPKLKVVVKKKAPPITISIPPPPQPPVATPIPVVDPPKPKENSPLEIKRQEREEAIKTFQEVMNNFITQKTQSAVQQDQGILDAISEAERITTEAHEKRLKEFDQDIEKLAAEAPVQPIQPPPVKPVLPKKEEVLPPPVQPKPVAKEPAQSPKPLQQMYKDLEKYGSKEFKNIWTTLFEHFDEDVVESWKKTSNNTYTVTLKQTLMLWVDPQPREEGDPKGGIVILFGANKARQGVLTFDPKNKSIQVKSGFDFYCDTPIGIKNVKVVKFQQMDKDLIQLECGVEVFLVGLQTETKIKMIDGILKAWKAGVVVKNDYDRFLRNKIKLAIK